MTLFYLAAVAFIIGAFASLGMGRSFGAAKVAALFAGIGSFSGLCFTLICMYTGATYSATIPLPLAVGSCLLLVDSLSTLFLLPLFLLGFLACLLLPTRIRDFDADIHYGRHGFFFSLFMLTMSLVLVAADGVFFLLAWEGMSLTPFFLLAPADNCAKKRFASWLYLIVAHLGALPLLLLFSMLSVDASSTAFADYALLGANPLTWDHVGFYFVLALIGFGAKMGLFPLHIWMPEAYPAAPGHVVVLLSGAGVNLGIYGLLRVLLLVGWGEVWWSYLLMGVGAFSGVAGIFFALSQNDIKRTLAYSSSENMGIVCLGLGAASLAMHSHASEAAVFFLVGTLLHMWNHSLFKSVLFLGASAVAQVAGTTNMNSLGGLQKQMPATGLCMGLGSAAIASLPPFNGFIGELLLYLGFTFGAKATLGSEFTLFYWLGLFTLSGIAGFSLFCFARMYGLTFLGAPRSNFAKDVRPVPRVWKRVMMFLAGLCICVCLLAPLLVQLFVPAVNSLLSRGVDGSMGVNLQEFIVAYSDMFVVLQYSSLACVAMLGFIIILVVVKRQKSVSGQEHQALTWDCGYLAPSARIQYTSGSFAQFPSEVMHSVLRPHLETPKVKELFPTTARAIFYVPDWWLALWNKRVFRVIARLSDKMKDAQKGILNTYILYILIALVAALVWALEGA